MPLKPINKMSKTFDQAIYDVTAFDLYSSRNIKFDELENLIDELNLLKSQTTYTRTSKGQYINLKTRSNLLMTKLEDENEALCTALFKINPKIQEDARFKEDQKVFRGWIKGLKNANLDLKVKIGRRRYDSYSVIYGSTSGRIRYNYNLNTNVKAAG